MTSTVVATQISSFTPTFQNLSVNETDRGLLSLEGNNQVALDAEIDNLMEDEAIDNPVELQLEVENPMSTNHFPTTPLTPDHSPSPSPPPALESPHNLEPPPSPPLEAETTTNPIQETPQSNPTTA